MDETSALNDSPLTLTSSGHSSFQLGQVPSMGQFGQVPSMGQLGQVPSMGQLGSVPSMGQLGSVPSMGQLGSVPSMGQLGQVPSMGQLGSVPSMGHLGPTMSCGTVGELTRANLGRFGGEGLGQVPSLLSDGTALGSMSSSPGRFGASGPFSNAEVSLY